MCWMTLHSSSSRLECNETAKLASVETSQEASSISNCFCLWGRRVASSTKLLSQLLIATAPARSSQFPVPVQCIQLYCAFVLWQRGEGQNSMNVFVSPLKALREMYFRNFMRIKLNRVMRSQKYRNIVLQILNNQEYYKIFYYLAMIRFLQTKILLFQLKVNKFLKLELMWKKATATNT